MRGRGGRRVHRPGPSQLLPVARQVDGGGRGLRDALSPAACEACFDDAAYYDEMMALTDARLAAIRESTVVVLSEYMRGELVAAGLPRRASTWCRRSSTFPRRPRPTGRPGPCVLFVGRLVEAKGPRDAVAAWRESGVPLPLVVAGTGPLARAEMEAAGADVLRMGAPPAPCPRSCAGRAPCSCRRAGRSRSGSPAWRRWPSGCRWWRGSRAGCANGIPGPLVPWGDVAGLARALRDAIGRKASMPDGFERDVLMQRLDDAYASAR